MIGNRYEIATGRIIGSLRGREKHMVANVTPEVGVYIGDQVNRVTHYIASDPIRVEPRPALAQPASPQAKGWVFDMSSMPAGTITRATNEAGQSVETADAADPITLTDAGTYTISARPPFPYIPFEMEIFIA